MSGLGAVGASTVGGFPSDSDGSLSLSGVLTTPTAGGIAASISLAPVGMVAVSSVGVLTPSYGTVSALSGSVTATAINGVFSSRTAPVPSSAAAAEKGTLGALTERNVAGVFTFPNLSGVLIGRDSPVSGIDTFAENTAVTPVVGGIRGLIGHQISFSVGEIGYSGTVAPLQGSLSQSQEGELNVLQGTVVPAIGITATGFTGAVSVEISAAPQVVSEAAELFLGTVNPATGSVTPLAGTTINFSIGLAATGRATGLSSTRTDMVPGFVSAISGYTAALTGVSGSFSQGSVATGTQADTEGGASVLLPGAINSSIGEISGITNISASVDAGSSGPEVMVPLSGAQVPAFRGTLSATTGNVSSATGESTQSSSGAVVASTSALASGSQTSLLFYNVGKEGDMPVAGQEAQASAGSVSRGVADTIGSVSSVMGTGVMASSAGPTISGVPVVTGAGVIFPTVLPILATQDPITLIGGAIAATEGDSQSLLGSSAAVQKNNVGVTSSVVLASGSEATTGTGSVGVFQGQVVPLSGLMSQTSGGAAGLTATVGLLGDSVTVSRGDVDFGFDSGISGGQIQANSGSLERAPVTEILGAGMTSSEGAVEISATGTLNGSTSPCQPGSIGINTESNADGELVASNTGTLNAANTSQILGETASVSEGLVDILLPSVIGSDAITRASTPGTASSVHAIGSSTIARTGSLGVTRTSAQDAVVWVIVQSKPSGIIREHKSNVVLRTDENS